jgi:hypothetical protein
MLNKKKKSFKQHNYHKLNVFTLFINVLQCFLCCNKEMTESISLTINVINKYNLLLLKTSL